MSIGSSNRWPPAMPHEKARTIATGMYLTHLSSLVEKDAFSKRALVLLRQLKEKKRTWLDIDFDDETGEPQVAVYMLREIRQEIDNIFYAREEIPFQIEYGLCATAINTLPDKLDLPVIADTLIAEFHEKMQDIENDGYVYDKAFPEGRVRTPDELYRLQEQNAQILENLRQFHHAILTQALAVPQKKQR